VLVVPRPPARVEGALDQERQGPGDDERQQVDPQLLERPPGDDPVETLASLGNKLAARQRAEAAGVPVVPGTFQPLPVGGDADAARIADEAERIGFPVLVKAAAGGGGRGMRRVDDPALLSEAVASAAREAAASFGDGSVYLERYVDAARHVEVQLLGDSQGTIVALGERDCSTQRRHQKLVEEAPAPGLTIDERRLVHELAVRAARAARLENAATAEFLFDEDRRFWFLEVNTRLQVEHGVTELVTDVDIVREQIAIAAGRPLSGAVRDAAARAAETGRHAIEVRLSAEDPARDFAPAPGVVGEWVMPAGPGVRVETAIRSGDRIPPDYDPLVAKILVVDEDRGRALARLARALAETVVTGIQTTLPFHRFIATDATFRAGPPPIDWVDEHWPESLRPGRAAALEAARWAAAAAAATVGHPADTDGRAGETPSEAAPWVRAGRLRAVDRWPGSAR